MADESLESLEELRRLSKKATPGVWFVDDGDEVSSRHSNAMRESPWPVIQDREGLLPAVDLADAQFIAAAVNHVRAVLDKA